MCLQAQSSEELIYYVGDSQRGEEEEEECGGGRGDAPVATRTLVKPHAPCRHNHQTSLGVRV